VGYIFLSHSSQDHDTSDILRSWLQGEGHQAIFVDHDSLAGIAGGEPWEERLYTELQRCRALIVLVTSEWLNLALVRRRGQPRAGVAQACHPAFSPSLSIRRCMTRKLRSPAPRAGDQLAIRR
jgi:TIR domain